MNNKVISYLYLDLGLIGVFGHSHAMWSVISRRFVVSLVIRVTSVDPNAIIINSPWLRKVYVYSVILAFIGRLKMLKLELFMRSRSSGVRIKTSCDQCLVRSLDET